MITSLVSATGNAFVLVDGIAGEWPADPSSAARELSAGPPRVDGILLVGPPRAGGDCAMQIWNADGSRAEMCGNGLRCVGRFAVERGYAKSNELSIETDAGPRRVRVLQKQHGEWSARAELGTPVLARRRIVLPAEGARPARSLDVVTVDLGNPHCVLFVEDERRADVAELGPRLQRAAEFPRGTNVEFAAPRGRRMGLRVWERGVGETRSCGSGACAAAAAAIADGRVPSPVEVEQAGGWLLVEWDGVGSLWLTGPVEGHAGHVGQVGTDAPAAHASPTPHKGGDAWPSA